MSNEPHSHFAAVTTGLFVVALVGLSGYLVYQELAFRAYRTTTDARLASMNDTLATLASDTDARLQANDQKDTTLSDMLYNNQKRIDDLESNVQGFDSTVGTLSGSVKTLEKLSTTDPELLQKYSRIYFLNENYLPSDLTVIDEKYDLVNGKQVSVLTDMWPFLKELMDDATRAKIDIMVLSGYRSFAEQANLKESYTVRYGAGANGFSADQGYSEHQLGTAVDFTTNAAGEELSSFEASPAFDWLQKNAYRYGFILSYPKDNAYYVYEPWHWRFVGKELAADLHRKNENFYDMEQREIDGYLSTLFDD
jgi:LAS superfamily LD-carboxypeptidase LdcB